VKVFLNIWIIITVFFILVGCMPLGSGSLKNYVAIKIDQRIIKVKLPSGYCADQNARVLTDANTTTVITNCVSVKQKNAIVFGRRPVDTIINLTVTGMRLPGSFLEKEFFNSLKENFNLKSLVKNSKSISLKVNNKILRDEFLLVDFQQDSRSSSIRKVRKYIFVVGKQVAILTITNFDSNSKPEYKKFESLIKLLKKSSS